MFRPYQWLHIDLVPLPVGGAIVLRDVSEAMEGFVAGDLRQATLDAVEIDGDIGHARISVRETVESANAMLTGLLGVDVAAVRRVRFFGFAGGWTACGLRPGARIGFPFRQSITRRVANGDARGIGCRRHAVDRRGSRPLCQRWSRRARHAPRRLEPSFLFHVFCPAAAHAGQAATLSAINRTR